MATNYSRRAQVEERKNIRKAYFLGFLSIVAVIFLFFLGIPIAAKVATFIADFTQSAQTYDSSDDTPPVSPRFDALPEYTNSKSIDVTGTTEAGATVLLFVNDDYTDALANSEGSFRFKATLKKGENTIYAKAKDSAGNESVKTHEYIVVFDDTAPELEVTKPENGASFYGQSQRNVVVEGMTEEGASVYVNDRVAIVSSGGKFSVSIGMTEGENAFLVSSTDQAGNKTEVTVTVTYNP